MTDRQVLALMGAVKMHRALIEEGDIPIEKINKALWQSVDLMSESWASGCTGDCCG